MPIECGRLMKKLSKHLVIWSINQSISFDLGKGVGKIHNDSPLLSTPLFVTKCRQFMFPVTIGRSVGNCNFINIITPTGMSVCRWVGRSHGNLQSDHQFGKGLVTLLLRMMVGLDGSRLVIKTISHVL